MAEIIVGQTITTQQYANADNTSLSYYLNAYLFYVDVTLISQDIVNALSKVRIKHRMKCVRSYYSNYNTLHSDISIGDEVKNTKYLPTTGIGQTYDLAEWTGDVPHDSQGNLSIVVKGIWHGYDDNNNYGPVSNTLLNEIQFPQILRASTINVSPTFLTSGNATIMVTKHDPAYTTTLKYRVNNVDYVIATKSSNTTFYLAYNTIKNIIGSYTSAVVKITAITYSGNTILGEDSKEIIIQTGSIPLSLYDDMQGNTGVTFGEEATGAGFNVKMNARFYNESQFDKKVLFHHFAYIYNRLIMSNATGSIVCVDSVANWINVLQMSAANILMLGYGTMAFDYDTTVYGKNVNLQNKYGGRVTLEDGNSSYAGYLNANNNTMTLGTTAKLWNRLYCRQAPYVSSDARAKKYINDLNAGYEDLFHRLNPKRFKMKKDGIDDPNWHIGFIAQEVEQAIREAGLPGMALIEHSYFEENGEQKDRYVLAYEEFIALNTHMIQKAYEKIGELENRITELEELVNG